LIDDHRQAVLGKPQVSIGKMDSLAFFGCLGSTRLPARTNAQRIRIIAHVSKAIRRMTKLRSCRYRSVKRWQYSIPHRAAATSTAKE
jgi:hypothetical protein